MSKQAKSGEIVSLYPGSFDPLTLGHIDIIERASRIFPKVIVAIGHSPIKPSLFSVNEKSTMLNKAFSKLKNIEIHEYNGLTIEYAKKIKASVIVRGLRSHNDLVYESQMAVTNRHLYPNMDTVFLTASPETSHISSTLVRDIASHQGKLDGLVPQYVVKALQSKFPKNSKQ